MNLVLDRQAAPDKLQSDELPDDCRDIGETAEREQTLTEVDK